ncbi:acyltransferase family protein [Brachybacterium sp. GCM10030267]|uniref:acyltransferase family protein n=1 Tax=Brachybacterium sp. GCM10030267 TaxID=3273381 RepID=UPI00360FDC3F
MSAREPSLPPRHLARGRRRATAAAAPAAAPPPPTGGHRPELHGLRGLAIALVVLYHVFFDRVSGGVDVFLFISAFFLTGTFMRRLESGRPTAPLAYWARTFKRLLPPAAVVILATLAAVRLFLPASTWMPAINDAIASILQVENWLLIHRGTDYEAAATVATSPLQHFWSLSIQGQVFLLWPVLFALCAVLARALHRSPRTVVTVLFGAIALGSFAWSLYSTAVQQPTAYFDTTARLWEFAAGALLALLPAARGTGSLASDRPTPAGRRRPARLSVPARVALGWAGLAVLISTGALIDGRSMFPGWIAAVPLLGASGVFLAGVSGSRFGADRVLTSPPFRFLGDVSYGLYLIHWPILAITLAATGREHAGFVVGPTIIAASLILAYGLTRLVDSPIRGWRWANLSPLRSGGIAVTVLVLGLAPSVGAHVALERAADEAERRAVADNPGGRVLEPGYEQHPDADPDAAPLPSAATLKQDWEHLEEGCSGRFAPADDAVAESCRMTAGPEDGPVIVAVGNSRLAQHAVSLSEPARENGWRLIILRRPSCIFTPGIESYKGPDCDAYNLAAMDYIRELQPEAVAVATTTVPHEGPEVVTPVVEDTVPQLLDEGFDVIALRDGARLEEDPVACLEAGGSEEECTQQLDPAEMPPERPDAALLEELSTRGDLYPVDVQPLMCPEGSCPPLIGNMHVMFDEDHATATYMASLGGSVDAQLQEAGFTW